MAKQSDDKSSVSSPPKNKVNGDINRLPTHFIETSWRVAVPILVFTISGIKLDERLGTNPLFSISGVLISLLFATILVYRYLKQNFPESFGGNK